MAVDAVTLITNDHRVLEGLFDQIRSGRGDRLALLDEVRVRLEAHSRAEEDHVYPMIAQSDPEESREVYHGYEEHHEAMAMLYAVKQMEPTDPEYQTKLTEFLDAVSHHIEEEEAEILPALAASISGEALVELGQRFEQERRQGLAAHGIMDAGMPDGSAMDLGELSKEELYEQAQTADIPGRAAMTKEQLVQAVRAAGIT